VSPYREAAEDLEAGLDALEIQAFHDALARRTLRMRVGVVLVVLLSVLGGLAAVAILPSLWFPTPAKPTPEAARVSHCETHVITPDVGAPFPMTVCR
jgi:hypothetical protein